MGASKLDCHGGNGNENADACSAAAERRNDCRRLHVEPLFLFPMHERQAVSARDAEARA
jgi:hypothetical protein